VRLRVVLLECDHVSDSLRHVAGDYRDMFAALFGAHAPEIELQAVDVVGGDPIPDVDACDGYVITGSRHSVTDDHPWLDTLRRTVVDAPAAGTPLVGICFGHQVIADSLGGRVERAEVGWGVGVHGAPGVDRTPW
jgi:GMP synthase-like glutamine amidotransferase